MTDPNPFAVGYRRLVQDLWAIIATWPWSEEEKADPEREALELAAWQRFYDRQIARRKAWIGRE